MTKIQIFKFKMADGRHIETNNIVSATTTERIARFLQNFVWGCKIRQQRRLNVKVFKIWKSKMFREF